MLYYYACITIASIPNYDNLFSILFGSLMLSLWIPIAYFLYFLKHQNDSINNENLYKYFLAGGVICTTVGIIWFSTEIPCKNNPKLAKYVYFTHGIWHIGMSLGIYYLITSVILLNYYLTGVDNIRFKKSKSYCKNIWFKIFPVLTKFKRVEGPLVEIK